MKFFEYITIKTKRIFIIYVFVNLSLVILVGGAAYMINLKNNSVESLEREIWIKEEKTKNMMAVKRLIEDSQEDLDILDSYFTTEDEVVEFIEEIENMGEKSGVALSLRSVNVEKENGNTLFVSLTTSGGWKNVYHFLNLLELFPVNIRIDKVSLAKKEIEDGSVWTGNFSLSLISFYEK